MDAGKGRGMHKMDGWRTLTKGKGETEEDESLVAF